MQAHCQFEILLLVFQSDCYGTGAYILSTDDIFFPVTEGTFKMFPAPCPASAMQYEGSMKLVSIMTITVD